MNFARVLLALAATLSAAAPAVGLAADFPQRPIQMIIGYPPGGSADSIGRPLATLLAKRLGVPVVVEYKPGAGGIVATQYVARSAPDGYTLGLVLASHAINPSLYDKLPYDSVRDFTPVAMVGKLPLMLYTNPGFPAKTVQELVEYARAKPGSVTFASAGNGNTSHLAMELLADRAGIKVLHVPYKGSGPAKVAAMAGEVSAMFDGPESLKLVEGGKLRALAFAGEQRSQLAPDVPTMAESGLDGVEVSGWYGLLAPAGTPADVVDTLNEAVVDTLRDPEFKKVVEPLGYIPSPSTPDEFMAYVRQEAERWAGVIARAGIKLQ